MEENPLIFLSYSSPDYERVHEYYSSLVRDGLDPWLDKEKLVAGQNWDFEIKKALSRSTIIVIFLSENSVSRRGYVQREIRIALDQYQNKLHDDIYIIPVMLDEVPIPEQLQSIQVITASSDERYGQLTRAINTQLERLGLESARLQGESQLRWNMTWHYDKWEGLPGYDTSYQVPRFSSEYDPQANDITDVVRGWLAGAAMNERQAKYAQYPDMFSFGQEPHFRMNTWQASCNTPIVHERFVSMSFAVWTMGAGAMHPNMFFKTFSFTLNPTTQISNLAAIFSYPEKALPLIQAEIRQQLLHENRTFDGTYQEGIELDEEWVIAGTKTWEDLDAFLFTENGIEFLFSPYQVSAYAYGSHFAKVKYETIAKFVSKQYAYALGIDHLQREYPARLGTADVASSVADGSNTFEQAVDDGEHATADATATDDEGPNAP